MSNHSCICCSDRLIRHIKIGKIYWYCLTCRQEMPIHHLTIQNEAGKSLIEIIPLPKPIYSIS